MADFKTHVTTSSVLGVAYGGAAFGLMGMPLRDCILASAFCGVSGMLPDIDSGPGRPLREITAFLAVMVPTGVVIRLHDYGIEQSWRILIALAIYAAIRFGISKLLKKYTVHRGMFHSLVAAAIFGEAAYLLLYGEEHIARMFITGGVVVGFMSHLLLDEIYSVQWDGRPRLKKSFGTATKLFGKGWWPNISAYGKLALLTFLVINDPAVVGDVRDGKARQSFRDLASRIEQALSPSAETDEMIAEPEKPDEPVLAPVFTAQAPEAPRGEQIRIPEPAQQLQLPAPPPVAAPNSWQNPGRTAIRPTYPAAPPPQQPPPSNVAPWQRSLPAPPAAPDVWRR